MRTFESDHPEGLTQFLSRLVGALPTTTASTAIPAEVNHGQWIVKCPYCTSAQQASEADPRFFCVTCRNAGAGGKWLPVAWPSNRTALEGVLEERPQAKTRNWTAVETLKDLQDENKQKGIR